MEIAQRVERYLQSVPKAELHVHLEGSIQPETFLLLAQRNSVNSDDPPLFNTSLNANVATLYDPFHFSLDTIDEILLNGVRHSFMSIEQKQKMEEKFQSEMSSLRQNLHL